MLLQYISFINNCMLPVKEIEQGIDSIRKTGAKDFSNLMPRPGWKDYGFNWQ